LAPQATLPDDAAISAAVGQARRARSTISTVEPTERKSSTGSAKASAASPLELLSLLLGIGVQRAEFMTLSSRLSQVILRISTGVAAGDRK
jgi:hypothetical protein